jgi:beta-glucanase (GH16 family)
MTVEAQFRIPTGFTKTLFYDDFSVQSEDSPLDETKWAIDMGTRYQDGGPEQWGTGEVQSYTNLPENIYVTNRSTLMITPLRDEDNYWTSARIETRSAWDFTCQRGQRVRVEARIRLGSNAPEYSRGIWPAFWILGAAYRTDTRRWPAGGEIDILENVNGLPEIQHAVHCGTSPGGPCHEPRGIVRTGTPFSRADWHTVAWEIDRQDDSHGNESMSWFVDGKEVWTLRESDFPTTPEWSDITRSAKMILLNVAVGGALPDGVAGVLTPETETDDGEGASMEIDHVAVFVKEP